MNTKFFVSALFAGLMVVANANAGYGHKTVKTTDNSPEETVETKKGEKLTGHWRGKYFVTDSGRAVHYDSIKEEHKGGNEKHQKRTAKQGARETAKAKMEEKKAAKAGKKAAAEAPAATEAEEPAE